MNGETPPVSGATTHPSLAAVRAATYKSRDAWWTVFVVDPIAARTVWAIIRVTPRLSPMTVTSASLVLGVAAGLLFGTGHLIWGAVAYQLSFLADCVDGKLARLQGRTSLLGAFYDGFTNHSVYAFGLAGLVVHALTVDAPWVLVGAVALIGLRVLTTHANRFVPRSGRNWASPFADDSPSWLTRHRLLPPFSFPDKHAVLFLLGPVADLLLVGIVINLALEAALLGRKLLRVVPALRDREHVEGWDRDLGVSED